MADVGGEILLVLVLVLFNGVLAMSEIAVVSVRRARLKQRADRGDAGAAAALVLAEEPTRFLSTVQIGITLVGILAGAFGGASIAARIGDTLATLPPLAPYAYGIGLAVVVSAITYLSLVVGELVPKRIGLAHAERIATVVARPMNLLSKATGPVVSLLTVSTDAILRLLPLGRGDAGGVTEADVRGMIAEGAEAGIFEAAEREMVESVFRLADQRVDELMTPRPRLTWLDLDDPPDKVQQMIVASDHSVYPVGRGELDRLAGVVSAKALLGELLAGRVADLEAVLEPARFVPESMRAFQLLEQFRAGGPRIALVVDEHGTIVGLLTPTDLLEAIVGDFPETADDATEIVRRADGSWLVDGLLPIDDLDEALGTGPPDPEERGEYRTVGGLVMHRLGRIPAVGNRVSWRGYTFEIVDMDGRRVDKLLVARGDPTSNAPAGEASTD